MDHKKKLDEYKSQMENFHKEEMQKQSESNIREMQKMFKDFEHGQAFLKRQITSLEKKLIKADEKYENRESRQEDVDMIEELNQTIEDYKQVVQTYSVSITLLNYISFV